MLVWSVPSPLLPDGSNDTMIKTLSATLSDFFHQYWHQICVDWHGWSLWKWPECGNRLKIPASVTSSHVLHKCFLLVFLSTRIKYVCTLPWIQTKHCGKKILSNVPTYFHWNYSVYRHINIVECICMENVVYIKRHLIVKEQNCLKYHLQLLNSIQKSVYTNAVVQFDKFILLSNIDFVLGSSWNI